MICVSICKEIPGEKFWYFSVFLMGMSCRLGTEIENKKLKTTEMEDRAVHSFPIIDATHYCKLGGLQQNGYVIWQLWRSEILKSRSW